MGVVKKLPDIEPDQSGIPLQTFEVSVQLYLILNDTPNLSYTVGQLKKIINTKYNENLGYKRIRQICEHLAQRGNIVERRGYHPFSNKESRVYQANEQATVLMDSTLYRVARRIELL